MTQDIQDSESFSVATQHGEMVFPAEDTIIAKSMKLYGEWAGLELEHVAQFIAPGDTILDVGGCYGTHAIAFASLTGSKGRVVTFEASPKNFGFLQRNVNAAHNSSIIDPIQSIIIASNEESFSIVQESENYGASKVVRNQGSDTQAGVRGTTLDALGLTRADFIKIDVEGMEEDVLRGAQELLKNQQPIVFFEVNELSGALAAMSAFKGHSYQFFGSVTLAFNANNPFKNMVNIFGEAKECGIFAVPESRLPACFGALSKLNLPQIQTADDITLLLLQKPQFFSEVLQNQASAENLDVPIAATFHTKSPDSARIQIAQRNEINRLLGYVAEITENNRALSLEATRLNALLEQSKMLEKRARKFPFSLYFKTKTKYRDLLRALRHAPLADIAPITIPDTLAAALKEDTPHPIGYKADILRHLTVPDLPSSDDVVQITTETDTLISDTDLGDLCASAAQVILSISHDDYTSIAGGTQLCVGLEQGAANRDGIDYVHIFPLQLTPALAQGPVDDTPRLGISRNGTLLGVTSYERLIAFAHARHSTGLETQIIVHHLLGHNTDALIKLINATQRRDVMMWLHDFFTLCSSPHLLRNRITFCGAPDASSSACGICAFGAARSAHITQIETLFQAADMHLIAPSDFVADLIRDRASFAYADLTVQPHLTLEWHPKDAPDQITEGPVRIAFLGAPADHKGWPNFLNIAKEWGDKGSYEFHYFGTHDIGPSMKQHVVSTSEDNRLAMVDAVQSAHIDIVIHISPTPESFSFTTYEAYAAGAAIVTNRSSGNTARVVAQQGHGLVLDKENELPALFKSGAILDLAQRSRAKRAAERAEITFSTMSMQQLGSKGAAQ